MLRVSNGDVTGIVDRLVAYWAEVSAGRLRIVPHVGATVVRLPEARTRYVQRASALAGDALRAFAATPMDEDERQAWSHADAAVVFFPGPGRESYMRPGESGDRAGGAGAFHHGPARLQSP